MDVQLIRRQSLVIGLLMLSGLTACQPSRASASAASPTYPVIPIPVHAALQGYGVYDNALGDISFYADNVDYPKGQGNGFYNQLLRQYGWEPCEGEEDYCYFQFVTDMDFVGAYQFGRGSNCPTPYLWHKRYAHVRV